ncbi:MAG TPA: restriction endonuclease subunit S, partial [Tissierellaceae bacterium]|nr:restriction endonuclease subunit S [Tissierellaceae bacterium]
MLDGWKEVRLDEICLKITDGAHYSPKGVLDGYPMLTVKDMREQGFDYTSCKKISQPDFDDMVRNDCVPKKNDVLVAKDGSYLKHVFVVKESKQEAILSSIAIFRPKIDILNPNYLKYFVLNPVTKRMIKENYVSGSAIPRIVLKDFKKIKIKLPKIDEQKAIANILTTLDEKIETNNKINKTLEKMAQEIFKHWFVDFEFPNGDGEPYKSSGGDMVESELGVIPKGWEVKTLEEISSNIITGKTPSTKDKSNFNGDIQFVKIPDMHGQVYITKTEAYLSESGVNDNKIIPPNSVMVSCIATPGLVSLAAEKCQTNQQINTIVNTNPK